MKRLNKKALYVALVFLLIFIAWTAAICFIDVQPIGPRNSSVGFAALNAAVHELTGVHMRLYTLTDWLGLVPLGFMAGFAALGLAQLIRRKSIIKVDADILALGVFYILVFGAYFLFEIVPVNYRPVLIEDCLEASYPSSTTLLTLCVIPTAIMQLKRRVGSAALCRALEYALWIFAAFMVVGRAVSGVHWITDIVGGVFLSLGLVTLYGAVCGDGNVRSEMK